MAKYGILLIACGLVIGVIAEANHYRPAGVCCQTSCAADAANPVLAQTRAAKGQPTLAPPPPPELISDNGVLYVTVEVDGQP